MHSSVRNALQELIENLTWSGSRLSLAADVIRGRDREIADRYDNLLRNLMGGEVLLDRRKMHGSPFLSTPADRLPANSIGAAVQSYALAAPKPGQSADVMVSELNEIAHELRLITRAVLGSANVIEEWSAVAFQAAQVPTLDSYLALAVLFARVGFMDPEAAIPVFDAFARGWLNGKASLPLTAVEWGVLWTRPADEVRHTLRLNKPPLPSAWQWSSLLIQLQEPGRLPQRLPALLWKLIDRGVDAATITPSIAAFGNTYDPPLRDACARAVLLHDGQAEVAQRPWLPRVSIDSLRHHPAGTLGHAYYHLIVDNGFDPEVLDPDSVTGFHPGLDASNRCILQTHEIWHLVAGYSTSPLHETAISAFQLAQFGHNYSAIFLATITLLLTLTQPELADTVFQVIAEGWVHGRRTRPLMLIDWFSLWGKPIDAIQRGYGIEPFRSVIADLLAAPRNDAPVAS